MRSSFSSNFADVAKGLQQMQKQSAFAFASALTAQVRSIADGLPGQMSSQLDRPTQFTQRGVFITPARKDNLRAVVGIKDAQAEYLHWQVDGGVRAPNKVALKLPSDVQLDAHGNIPRALVKKLIARADAGRRATKRQSERFGVSRAVDLFYGRPDDGRPGGIYKRVGSGDTSRLIAIVVFPRTSASYKPRLDFWGYCSSRANAELGGRMVAGLEAALATAK